MGVKSWKSQHVTQNRYLMSILVFGCIITRQTCFVFVSLLHSLGNIPLCCSYLLVKPDQCTDSTLMCACPTGAGEQWEMREESMKQRKESLVGESFTSEAKASPGRMFTCLSVRCVSQGTSCSQSITTPAQWAPSGTTLDDIEEK